MGQLADHLRKQAQEPGPAAKPKVLPEVQTDVDSWGTRRKFLESIGVPRIQATARSKEPLAVSYDELGPTRYGSKENWEDAKNNQQLYVQAEPSSWWNQNQAAYTAPVPVSTDMNYRFMDDVNGFYRPGPTGAAHVRDLNWPLVSHEVGHSTDPIVGGQIASHFSANPTGSNAYMKRPVEVNSALREFRAALARAGTQLPANPGKARLLSRQMLGDMSKFYGKGSETTFPALGTPQADIYRAMQHSTTLDQLMSRINETPEGPEREALLDELSRTMPSMVNTKRVQNTWAA